MELVESVFWRKHCYEYCWENVSWATTWQMEGEGLPKVHGGVSGRGCQDNQIVKVIIPSLGLIQTSWGDWVAGSTQAKRQGIPESSLYWRQTPSPYRTEGSKTCLRYVHGTYLLVARLTETFPQTNEHCAWGIRDVLTKQFAAKERWRGKQIATLKRG